MTELPINQGPPVEFSTHEQQQMQPHVDLLVARTHGNDHVSTTPLTASSQIPHDDRLIMDSSNQEHLQSANDYTPGLVSHPAGSTDGGTPSGAPQWRIQPSHDTYHVVTRSKSGIFKPKVLLATKHPLQHGDIIEPTCFSEAIKDLNIYNAMSQELNALLHNGTWILVPQRPQMNIVGCKWVFKLEKSKWIY